MFTQNEINRAMFNNQYSQQQQQQQQRMNHNTDLNHVHPNMSKFFDFHKQQQQNQFMMNSNPLTDQLNMANLLDNHHRMNQNGKFFILFTQLLIYLCMCINVLCKMLSFRSVLNFQ